MDCVWCRDMTTEDEEMLDGPEGDERREDASFTTVLPRALLPSTESFPGYSSWSPRDTELLGDSPEMDLPSLLEEPSPSVCLSNMVISAYDPPRPHLNRTQEYSSCAAEPPAGDSPLCIDQNRIISWRREDANLGRSETQHAGRFGKNQPHLPQNLIQHRRKETGTALRQAVLQKSLQDRHKSSGLWPQISSPQSSSSLSSSYSSMPRKRDHSGQQVEQRDNEISEGNEDSGDEGQAPPGGARKRARHREPSKLLACPFWKYDPGRYSENNVKEKNYRHCSSCYASDIARLKQHLYRVHKVPENHCVRCFEVFKSRTDLDNHHLSKPNCEVKESPFPEKFSAAEHDRLKNRRMGKSVEDCWFAIWEILFPNSPRPSSIYFAESASTIRPAASAEFTADCYQRASDTPGDILDQRNVTTDSATFAYDDALEEEKEQSWLTASLNEPIGGPQSPAPEPGVMVWNIAANGSDYFPQPDGIHIFEDDTSGPDILAESLAESVLGQLSLGSTPQRTAGLHFAGDERLSPTFATAQSMLEIAESGMETENTNFQFKDDWPTDKEPHSRLSWSTKRVRKRKAEG